MNLGTVLLTGAHGQLGYELARLLGTRGNLIALGRDDLDLADADAIVDVVRQARPDVIVNAGAYTAVDRAESEPKLAHAVNAKAPEILALEARRQSSLLIHYSTDYVFDGLGHAPLDETAPTHPLGVYGSTKLEGEQAILSAGGAGLVFRTSWVYGRRGRNFLLTIERLAAERDELRIVSDQIGVPNWCRILAHATVRVLERGRDDAAERAGLYHMSSTGQASWHEFACAIVGPARASRVKPIATAEYPTPARRPGYGVLDGAKFTATFGFALPPWRDALAACMADAAEPLSA